MEFIKKIFSLLILYHSIHESKAACNDHTSCRTCTSDVSWLGATCQWCPLTSSCHAKWSFYNDCTNNQNIISVSDCASLDEKSYKYNATESFKLAMFSAVAYSDKPDKCLPQAFPGSDYNVTSILLRNCDDYIFDYDKHCMAFVAHSETNKEVIVAFRGTMEVQQIVDQVFSTLSNPTVSSTIGGKVQHYFNNVHLKFYDTVKDKIKDFKKTHSDYRVKITGHSLGGAVASIISARLVQDAVITEDDISLYTFGMPKVGNKNYAIAHDKLVPDGWRVVRKDDIVSQLPSCTIACPFYSGPYHHGNKVIYSGSTMAKNSTYYVCDGNEDPMSECAEQTPTRRKRAILDFTKHTEYFGIRLGMYCLDKGIN